jgi:hypothetical protein
MTCVPRLQGSTKKAKLKAKAAAPASKKAKSDVVRTGRTHATSNDTKRRSDSADKSNSAEASKKKSKSGDSADKTKADNHDTPIDAEKLALKEAIKALTALDGPHDTGLIEITGIKGTDTVGAIGFACIYDGDDCIVHVNEIYEADKAEFALSVARWLKNGGLGGRYDHKAGVVRDLDILLDSILGKGNGPRLTDRICVQAPNDRTPLSPRFSLCT